MTVLTSLIDMDVFPNDLVGGILLEEIINLFYCAIYIENEKKVRRINLILAKSEKHENLRDLINMKAKVNGFRFRNLDGEFIELKIKIVYRPYLYDFCNSLRSHLYQLIQLKR